MKKNIIVITKNIFSIITVIWSVIMLIEYLLILLPFSLNGVIYEIFNFFEIFLFSGIWCVPVLFVVSVILVACVREKYKAFDRFRLLNTVTIAIPVVLAALMLLTDFNARLQ